MKRASKAGGAVLLGVLSACANAPESGAEAVATIRQLFTGLFKTMKVSKYKCRVSEAEIYGNVAYDRGECEWESVAEGQSFLRWQGRYYAVRHRGADGVWRLHRLIENELPSQ